jgi:hypothetical protein
VLPTLIHLALQHGDLVQAKQYALQVPITDEVIMRAIDPELFLYVLLN